MGPEGIPPLTNSLQFTDKIPLSFDGYGDYQQYRENIELWDAMTSISAERRAPTIIGQLTGQAQITAKALSLSVLYSEQGVCSLLREMDKKFGMDAVSLLHNNISNFFDFCWDKHMSVEEFVVGFHTRLDKISKLDMNEELKGHLLLKQANLDGHDRNLVVGAAGGDYSLQSLATSLRNSFRSEGLPASSMNTHCPRVYQPFSPMISKNYNPGDIRSATTTTSEPASSSDPLFYTYMSAEGSTDVPSAIIDSGSCCSVVGKNTLDRAMRQLKLEELKDEPISQGEHLFGPSSSAIKTICAVRVPFRCKVPNASQPVKFDIRFDVIPGSLPFLIGLPSLLAMKAMLSFQYRNITLMVRSITYRLQLIRSSSHLELPLICEATRLNSPKNSHETRPMNISTKNTRLQGTPKNFYTPPRKPSKQITLHSAKGTKTLSKRDIHKLHEQLEHATATRMKKFIREAQGWNPSYARLVDTVCANCSCAMAAPPVPRPVCTASPIPDSNQTNLSIDIVFFNRKPFMHVIDNRTKWSELGLLRTRRPCDQITVFKRIQLYRHGIPKIIRADQEFNKGEFLRFCESLGIQFQAVAANHHEGNALVEKANRSIRDIVSRIALAEPRLPLIDIVSAATFHKNTTRGNNPSSAFELLYHRCPQLSTICNPGKHGTAEENIAGNRRRQIQAALSTKTRTGTLAKEGDQVFFHRDRHGWIGPGVVVKRINSTVHILHNGRIKTADIHRIRIAPKPRDVRSIDLGDEDNNQEYGLDKESSRIESPPKPKNPSKPRRTQAQLLIEENKELLRSVPERRVPRRQSSHLVTTAKHQPNPPTEERVTAEEKDGSYQKEKEGWVTSRAYVRVPKSTVPEGSNIVGSHVVYRRKADGSVKARIVPWGHRDIEKDDVRGDAPSLNIDSMRILLSKAAEMKWRIRKMDVKSAYLQAKGFHREIYIRPPKEEGDATGLWKLLVPAYGLTDSGRLWYLTSYEALTRRFGFAQSRLDASMYHCQKDQETLLLVVQVDDYLYAGTEGLAQNFENFLQHEFLIGSTESNQFNIMGAYLKQDDAGNITINAKKKLEQIKPLDVGRKSKLKDRPATKKELTEYRSVIGKLLYIGRLVSPVIAFHASNAATKCGDLRLHHLKALSATLRAIKNYPCTLTYLASDGKPFVLEAMSDASLQTGNDKTIVREGILILRRSGHVVHAIGWVSRLARRVARSTSTAELLAAADAVDRLAYLRHLLAESSGSQQSELIIDSRSAYHLCTTTKEPEEIRNKLLLASIREEFNSASLIIRWTPGPTHLADALTKDNQTIAKDLNQVLVLGTHCHPDTSYAIGSDVAVPLLVTNA